MESPNLEFEYGDTDTLTAELSGETWQAPEKVETVLNSKSRILSAFVLKINRNR